MNENNSQNKNDSQISEMNNKQGQEQHTTGSYQQGNANAGINSYQQGSASVGANSYQQGSTNTGINSYQQGSASVGVNSYQQGNAGAGINSYQQGNTGAGVNSYQQGRTNGGMYGYQQGSMNGGMYGYQQGSINSGMNQYQKNAAGQNVNSYSSAGNGMQNSSVYGNASRPYVAGNEGTAQAKDKKHKSNTNKKSMGVGGKILLTAVYGLVFGIVAGLAFFAIREIGGVISPNTNSSTNIVPSTDVANLITDVIDEVDSSDGNGIANTDVTNNQPAIQTNTSTTLVVTDVTNVVDKVMPSIVSIRNSFTANYFYYTKTEEASGSGIIIGSNDEELLIVTNYHVIQDADTLTITFCDNSEAVAQVKGKDQSMDLAVIAVNYQELTKETKDNIRIATMGDSNNLKVGETAIAIGNSLGYGQSVTTGVVSALNREMDMDGVKGTFIQTDAAINPGNSGGALLNIAGEVIGINSNKIGGSAVEGMGYAIPISAAKPILEDLMSKETKKLAADDKQAYLGISGANITAQEQLFYGYPNGIYVANVSEGTAAEKGGLQKGDFIVEFDGENVSTMEDLQKLLMYYEEGDTVDLKVYRSTDRGYEEVVITVTLGNRADAED